MIHADQMRLHQGPQTTWLQKQLERYLYSAPRQANILAIPSLHLFEPFTPVGVEGLQRAFHSYGLNL